MEIKAILKFKHGYLCNFLNSHNMTIKKLAEIADIGHQSLGQFIRFSHNLTEEKINKLIKAMVEIDPDVDIDKICPKEMKKAIEVLHPIESTNDIPLENLVSYSQDKKLLDFKVDEQVDIDNDYENLDIVRRIVPALEKSLNKRQLFIVKKYYGIDGEREYSLDEIAESLNISRERVRQIKTKALRRLCRNDTFSMNVYDHKRVKIYYREDKDKDKFYYRTTYIK